MAKKSKVNRIVLGVEKPGDGSGSHGGEVSLPGWMYAEHFAAALDGRERLVDESEFSNVAADLWKALHPIGFRFVSIVYASGRTYTYREPNYAQ